MKPVFKCDYCNFMGTKEEVERHEPTCTDNYDRQSCYTCEHRIYKTMNQIECKCGKEIPEGKIMEFCPDYIHRERVNTFSDILSGIFGGF